MVHCSYFTDLTFPHGTTITTWQWDYGAAEPFGNIFHTTGIEVRWNGKANNSKEIAQRDVYVYLVKLTDFREGEHQYRGTVTLVR